jgi:hypothetical protein
MRGLSPLFWIGLLLIYSPAAISALSRNATRAERIILILMIGVALYLVTVLFSPNAFGFVDEFIDLRTTQDILRSHHLFHTNPLLAASAYYPGLEILATDIINMTGLSTLVTGLLLMGLVRALFCVCFYLVADRVTNSPRAAVAATLIYMANPMFLFWSSYFEYENLALPVAVFALWWLARTRREPGLLPLASTVLVIVGVAATHHLVGVALAAILMTWWFVERARGHASQENWRLLFCVMVAAASTLVWIETIARPAITYLWTDNIFPGLSETILVLLGREAPRHLYTSAGEVAPLWERLAGFGGVIVLLLALPLGLALVWRTRRERPLLLAAAGVALLYPLSLLPRLAPEGVAISGRSSEYLYAGLGCVIGLLMVAGPAQRTVRWARAVGWLSRLDYGRAKIITASALLTLIFIGGVTVGTPYDELIPEPNVARLYPTSVQPDVFTSAQWALRNLGPDRRFATDALDAPVLGSVGEENPIAENDAWPIFFAKTMNRAVIRAIRRERVQYLMVDVQMAIGVPANPSYYFTPYEPDAGDHAHPLPMSYLDKFSTTACSNLIFASQYIRIYDVEPIADGSCVPHVPVAPSHATGGAA